jgi:peptidoglycan/xylan/chitin deacetylase (PgdA/CDA1 family)
VLLRLALAPALVWLGYAWVAHAGTLLCARRGDPSSRRIALTFDDGPDPAYTPRVLDLLDAAGARGTFFVVGERAARARRLVAEMAARGHEVASHGWSHKSFWTCGPRRTWTEIARTHDLLAETTGRAPAHFRPPWGAVNAAMFPALRRIGERCVLWSIQPEGLRPAAASRQVDHVVRRAHGGAIVDLHDAEGTPGAPARLVEALPRMLDALRQDRYVVTTVTDVLAEENFVKRG